MRVGLTVLLSVFSLSFPCFGAAPVIVPMTEAQLQSDSLQLYISQRGQTYFETGLQAFLEDNGIFLDRGKRPEFKTDLPTPTNIKQFISMIAPLPEPFLSSLARGIQSVKPEVTLQNFTYQLTFGKLSAGLDETKLSPGASSAQVPLVLEIGVRTVDLKGDQVLLSDLAHPKLGQIGLQAPTIKSGDGSPALTAKVFITASVSSAGKLSLTIDPNRTQVNLGANPPNCAPHCQFPDLEPSFTRPVIPDNSERWADTQFSVTADELNTLIQPLIPLYQEKLEQALANFVKAGLPQAVNSQFESILAGKDLAETNLLDPPGVTQPVQAADRFQWKIVLSGLDVTTSRQVHGNFNTYLIDPKNPTPVQIPATPPSSPSLSDMDASTYDVAVAVNRDFVNRLLAMSFQRGAFDSVSIKTSETSQPAAASGVAKQNTSMTSFNFTNPPVVTLAPPVNGKPDHKRAKIHIEALATIQDKRAKIVLNGPALIGLDVFAHPEVKDGDLRILLDEVDLKSLDLHNAIRSGIRWIPGITSIFNGIAKKIVQNVIATTNKDLKANPVLLTDNIPIPKAVGGIPLGLKDVFTEETGYLSIFFEYGDSSL